MKSEKKIPSKKVIVIFSQIFIIIISSFSLLLVNNINGSLVYTMCSLIIVLNAILSIIGLKSIGISGRNLSFVFIISIYVLHFGQIIIHGFFPNYEFQRFNFIELISSDSLIKAVSYSLLIINITIIGIISGFKYDVIRENNPEINNPNLNERYRKIFLIGKYITLICAPLFFYLSINSIMAARQAAYAGGVNTYYGAGIMSTLGYFAFSGLYMMIYAVNDKKKRLALIFVAIIISLGAMISGERGHQLTFLIALLFLPKPSLGKSKKIKFSSKIMYLVGAYLGAAFINAIFTVRGLELKSFSIILDAWIEGLKQNPILILLEELGGTIYTIQLTIEKVPNVINPGFGMTYLTSIFSAIPNVGSLFTGLNKSSHFVNSLNTATLGGSYIGEIYYNFLYLGIIPAFIFGLIISKFSNRVLTLMNRNNPIELAITVQVYAYVLWWARDSFMSLIRPVVWCLIFVWLVQMFIVKRNGKNSEIYSKNNNKNINNAKS